MKVFRLLLAIIGLATSNVTIAQQHRITEEARLALHEREEAAERESTSIAQAIDETALVTDDKARLIVINTIIEGSDAACFKHPLSISMKLGAEQYRGMIVQIELSGDNYQGFHSAFLRFLGSPARACLPTSITVAGHVFNVEFMSADRLHNYAVAGGSSRWRKIASGFMISRSDWARADGRVVSFERLLQQVGAAERPGGLMETLFGHTADHWIGVVVSSLPKGATIKIDGESTPFRTDGEVWIAASKLRSANLVLGRAMIPLSQCTVFARAGKLTAALDCRLSR